MMVHSDSIGPEIHQEVQSPYNRIPIPIDIQEWLKSVLLVKFQTRLISVQV